MSDESVIAQIVQAGQPGNSALAEMQRRFNQASGQQGKRMWWLTVTIAGLAVVQVMLAVCAPSSTNARIDDLRAGAQTDHAEIRTDVRGHDDRLRAVEVAIEKLQLAEKLLRQEGDPPSATGDPPE